MLSSAILLARSSHCPLNNYVAELETSTELPSPTIDSNFALIPVSNDNVRPLSEELAHRLSAAQRELALLAMHLPEIFRQRTVRQLKQLLSPNDWDEDDAHMDLASFKSFARAMAALIPKERPMLGLSDVGNILAMWTLGESRLSFEHLANDELRWFLRNRGPEGLESATGLTTTGGLLRIVAAHGMRKLLDGER